MSELPSDLPTRAFCVGDVLRRIDAGWSPLCNEDPPSPGKWGVLKVSAVTSGSYRPTESKTLLPGMIPRSDIEVLNGDIVMCRANGAKELVGAVVMASGTPPHIMLSDKTLRLVVEPATVDPRFFYHYLTSWRVKSQIAQLINGGTGQTNISQSSIRSIKITVPLLTEQRRIAETLDAIDDEISAKEAVTAKLECVRIGSVRSIMHAGLECYRDREAFELYSGIQRRTGSWSLVPMGTVLLGIDAGRSPDLEDTPAGPGQWGVLKVSAVGQDRFRPEENKVVHAHGLRNPALCVRQGDLLMTRANTSELVGRSCIVDETPDGLMLCDKTLRLQANERSAPTKYVHIVLSLAEVRRQIEIAATGTSGSMKNISQQSIRKLMIPLGNPDDVQRVVEIDTLHEDQLSALNRNVTKLRLLKQGLMEDLLTGRVRVSDL